MKNSQSGKQEKNHPTQPIHNREEVNKNPDPKIDEDFKGYPHAPAKDELITPKTNTQKKTAATDKKDGEKKDRKEFDKKQETDEQDSDGSANAFEGK